MAIDLRSCPVIVLDCQATGASPAHGHLLELGWLTTRADAVVEHEAVRSHVVALPEGAQIPAIVRELTGIGPDDVAGAPTPAQIWDELRAAIVAHAPVPVPAIIHFARFELAFLQPLHASLYPEQPFPLRAICTHEIARRLLPGIPRRGLRILAGYFGHGADELRRSREHVWTTARIWRDLVDELAAIGIDSMDALSAWLATPATRASRRTWPMPRERRLDLPDAPGVYRMLRRGGDVLYVGKATSLRKRVNTYFQKQSNHGDRTLELLSQARDLAVTETASVLEAAVLESDEIKRLDPPFNVALKASRRAVWYADRSLALVREPGRRHDRGPLGSPWSLRRFEALLAAIAGTDPLEIGRAMRAAVGRPTPGELDDAIASQGRDRFVAALAEPRLDARALPRIGAVLWRARLAAGVEPPAPIDEDDDARERPWTVDDVVEAATDTVVEAARALRRARWLAILMDAEVSFVDGAAARVLVLRRGRVIEARDRGLAAGVVPAESAPFDLAAYDRLCVITSELRRILAAGGEASVRFGRSGWLAGERLRRRLAWV